MKKTLIQTEHLFTFVILALIISVKRSDFLIFCCFYSHFLKWLSCCIITFIFFFISTMLTTTEFKVWCHSYTNKVPFGKASLSPICSSLKSFRLCDLYRRCWLLLWLWAHWSQWESTWLTPLVCLSKKGQLDLSIFPCKIMTCYLKVVNKSLTPHYL